MYDNDALTIGREQVGAGTYTFLPANGVRYIVGVGVQQSGQASDTLIKCGDNIVSRNYGKDANFQQISYKCNAAITLDKTGNDNAFITMTYIPRDLSLEPPSVTYLSTASGNLVEAGVYSRVAMQGLTYIIFLGFAMLILLQCINMGTWFFRRNL